MKNYFLPTAIAFSLLFILGGCRKEGTETCIGGANGNVTLSIYPQHHGEAIPGATAYIKFNTRSSPGSLSNFDFKIVGNANEDHIDARDLRCGDYFIYCIGMDSTETVLGGIPYTIPSGTSGVLSVYVPVTE